MRVKTSYPFLTREPGAVWWAVLLDCNHTTYVRKKPRAKKLKDVLCHVCQA